MRKQRLCDTVSCKLRPEIRELIEKIAHRKECNMSDVVRDYLFEGLRRDGATC